MLKLFIQTDGAGASTVFAYPLSFTVPLLITADLNEALELSCRVRAPVSEWRLSNYSRLRSRAV